MHTDRALPHATLWTKGLTATVNALTHTRVSRALLACAVACLASSCGNDSDEQSPSATTVGPASDSQMATGQGTLTGVGDPNGTEPMGPPLPGPSSGTQPSNDEVAAGGASPAGTPTGGMSTNTGGASNQGTGGSGGGTGAVSSEPGGGGMSTDSGGAPNDDGGGGGGALGGSAGELGSAAGAGGTESSAGEPSGDVPEGATIVPDPEWACGMDVGIPSPTLGELAFTITLNIRAEHEVGNTPYGYRRLLDVSGGTITGDRLQGTVLTGGLEYELRLSNGVIEYQGINVLETSAGRIFVRSCGVATDEASMPRIIPDFEATTSGANAFLNTGTWVATREVADGTMTLAVYDVSGVTPGEPRVEITKPEGVPPQPWECNMTGGTRGAEVLTENVTLGTSYSIANAKYGSRNIIPITGGTTSGRVTGTILDGGADYQLSGSLDAWYTLAPDNGELILVRNCGGGGGLIPWFEAAVDGEFDFLNTQAYLSSDPGVGAGGVSITFYERN